MPNGDSKSARHSENSQRKNGREFRPLEAQKSLAVRRRTKGGKSERNQSLKSPELEVDSFFSDHSTGGLMAQRGKIRYVFLNRSAVSLSETPWKPHQTVINRSSTARCVLPSVYIGFRSFVLPKRFSGQFSSMPWRARGSVVSWANRPVGVPSCPAPPCPAPRRAPPCSDPPRVCPGFGFDRITNVLCFFCRFWFFFRCLFCPPFLQRLSRCVSAASFCCFSYRLCIKNKLTLFVTNGCTSKYIFSDADPDSRDDQAVAISVRPTRQLSSTCLRKQE